MANSTYAQSIPGSPRLSVDVSQQQQQTPRLENTIDSAHDGSVQQHAVVKRPRVSQPVEKPPSSGAPGKRGPGRPRKSISQATKPDLTQTPKPLAPRSTPLSEQTVNVSGGSQKERSNWDGSPNEQQSSATRRGAGRPRSTRSRSRAPPVPPANSRKSRHSDMNGNHPEHAPAPTVEINGQEPLINGDSAEHADSGKENSPQNQTPNSVRENAEEIEKRKARDYMARLAMQREEAMEMEEGR